MLELQRVLSQGPSSTYASQWNHRGAVLDASGAIRRSARLKSAVSTIEPSSSSIASGQHMTLRRAQIRSGPRRALNSSSQAKVKSNDERAPAASESQLYKCSSHLRRNSLSTASTAGGGTRTSSWSAKDDEVLIQARAQGLNWNQISPKHFPMKSANACRKRHERLMERQNAEQWDGVKLDILSQAYMDARREMWCVLAARVGEKWTLVEQKCMEKGLKNLTQAYRSAQKKQNDGTYHDQPDSGIGISDLDDTHEEDHAPAPAISGQARVPSLQSMLGSSTCDYLTGTNPARHESLTTLEADTAHGCHTLIHDRGLKSIIADDIGSKAMKDGETEFEVQARHSRIKSPESSEPEMLLSREVTSVSRSPEDEAIDISEDSMDDSGLDSSMDIDKQKEETLDRLMLYFYDLFAYTQFSQHNGDNSSSPECSTNPKHTTQAPSRETRRSGRKRKSDESTERDEREDEDDDKPSKRARGTNESDILDTSAARRLACPYYKRNKGKHQPSRACAGPGWLAVHRLKEHLYREHSMPLHCRRCYITFEDEAQLTDHSRSSDGCVIRDTQPIEGFDKDQEKKLKSRRSMFRAESEEHKWKIVYLILFPDTAPTDLPAPYYDLETEPSHEQQELVSPKGPEFKQFGAYMSRELPRQVRKALEVAMDKTFGPIEETLKNEMENIVRNCQEQLTTNFMKSIQAPKSATNAAPGPSGTQATAQSHRAVELMGRGTMASQASPVDDLSQFLIPPYATLDSWSDPVNMDFASPSNAWSESAYFSQPGGLNNSLLNNSWKPSENETNPAACADTSHVSNMIALDPCTQTYVGKGKGRAIDTFASIGHVI